MERSGATGRGHGGGWMVMPYSKDELWSRRGFAGEG